MAGGPYTWETTSIDYSISIVGIDSEVEADGTFTIREHLRIENMKFLPGTGTTNLIEVLQPGALEIINCSFDGLKQPLF